MFISRRFCFEIITPVYTRIYQATCAEEMDSWVAVINNAIEGVLNGTKSVVGLSGIVKADKETPINWASNGMPVRRRSTSFLPELKAGPSFLSMLRADPSNHVCADCGAPGPDWCVINFGALVCIGK
jgi:Arf-GAP with SH3 domain, ANK repeat and PH domain-containing protein